MKDHKISDTEIQEFVKDLSTPFFRMVRNIICKLEKIGVYIPGFARLYRRLFYNKIVSREIELARIKPGEKILHIGCGALPLTSFALVEFGCQVTALENSSAQLRSARKIAKSQRLVESGDLQFELGEGTQVDSTGYQAVWVSLHVYPQLQVLKSVFKKLSPGGRIVYRTPRGWLAKLYPRVEPEMIADNLKALRVKGWLGKQSLVLEKLPEKAQKSSWNHDRTGNPLKILTLNQLHNGEQAVITDTPQNDLLAPLGLRPGRKVRLRARESFGGPLVVETSGRKVAVDRSLADNIKLVRENND